MSTFFGKLFRFYFKKRVVIQQPKQYLVIFGNVNKYFKYCNETKNVLFLVNIGKLIFGLTFSLLFLRIVTVINTYYQLAHIYLAGQNTLWIGDVYTLHWDFLITRIKIIKWRIVNDFSFSFLNWSRFYFLLFEFHFTFFQSYNSTIILCSLLILHFDYVVISSSVSSQNCFCSLPRDP